MSFWLMELMITEAGSRNIFLLVRLSIKHKSTNSNEVILDIIYFWEKYETIRKMLRNTEGNTS